MKNTIPQKIPVLFSRPKKIPASFIDPKKSLLAKMSDPKKSFGPPVIKICEWGPWADTSLRRALSAGPKGVRLRDRMTVVLVNSLSYLLHA